MTTALYVDNVWLVPAVPLVSALLILIIGKSRTRIAAGIAVTGQVIAFAIAALLFVPTLRAQGFGTVHNFTWFTFGETALRLGFIYDPLTAAMLVMITFVGLWIF